MNYIITESQQADLILKTVFRKKPKEKNLISRLLNLHDSDFELGKIILNKAKNNEIEDVVEIGYGNTNFKYRFIINGFPFEISWRYKVMSDPKNNKRYSLKVPDLLVNKEINVSDDLLELITDYLYPKGYELAKSFDV
jgi:hypothetical protein